MAFFFNPSVGHAQGQQEGGAKTAEAPAHFDAGKEILHHIQDGYEFHLFTIGDFHLTVPLPVIVYSKEKGLAVFSSSHLEEKDGYKGYKLVDDKIVAVQEPGKADPPVKVYDLSMSRNVVQMLLAAFVLLWLMTSVARKYQRNGFKKAPSGAQGFVEPVILFIRDEVARPALDKDAERFSPFILTIFFFILVNNLFGLIPGSANVTGNIAVTMALALLAFIAILFSSNRHYWGHIFWPPGVPFGVKLILIPVELMSNLVVKPAALMIRLFANMAAGHIVILSFVSLIFIFSEMSKVAGIGFTPVSVAFCVFIYFIEILVAFIQAFIFATLTAVFISQACDGHAHGHDDDAVIL